MALVVKNPPAIAGDIRDVDWEDPLEKGIATYSSILVSKDNGEKIIVTHSTTNY